MAYIEKLSTRNLKWTQPHALRRRHELRADGELYASLRWKKMYGSLAVGECHEGSYTFKREGFLKPRITVRREGSEANLAVLMLRFNLTGTVEFETGEGFVLSKPRFLRSQWIFTDETGAVVMTFTRRGMGGKPSGEVTIENPSRRIPYLHVLMLLGWYAIILGYEESEAAVGLGFYATPSLG